MSRFAQRCALVGLLLAAYGAEAQQPSAKPEDGLAAGLRSLAGQVREVTQAHAVLYLGKKKVEQAATVPAILWHIGESMSPGGDLTEKFYSAHDLGAKRDAAKLEALAATADQVGPQAEELLRRAAPVADSARKLAAQVAALKPAAASTPRPLEPAATATTSECDVLLRLAAAALEADPPQPNVAASRLAELAARLDHLADLDRWLALNCRFLHETNAWTKEPGLAPRSLCYSIEVRSNETAAIQSRVEDILVATPAEQLLWAKVTRAAAGADKAPAALPPQTAPSLAAMQAEIAKLRKDEVELDRKLAALCHERKINEATAGRIKDYLPLVAKLEYAQREAALLEWFRSGVADGRLVSGAQLRPLSLTSRAALSRVVAALDERSRTALKPVLAEMLRRPYLASYADLCLYQSAVLATEPQLAERLRQWLSITPAANVRELMEIMHPTPGLMTTAERSDNAYQPQIMEWAAKCRGRDALARFKEALALTHEFATACGYNADKPVYTLRDILESRLVDCLAASQIQGAVAAAAGVTGIVPVRYWREKNGHSVVGLRTAEGLLVMDPLVGPQTRTFPGQFHGVVTVETGAPTFGTFVADALEIVATGKVLRLELPYLESEKAPKN